MAFGEDIFFRFLKGCGPLGKSNLKNSIEKEVIWYLHNSDKMNFKNFPSVVTCKFDDKVNNSNVIRTLLKTDCL